MEKSRSWRVVYVPENYRATLALRVTYASVMRSVWYSGAFLTIVTASGACSSTNNPGSPAGVAGSGGSAAIAEAGGAGQGGVSGTAGGGAAAGGESGGATAGAALGGGAGTGGTGGSGGSTDDNLQYAKSLDEFRMDLACHHPQDQPCEPQNQAMPNLGYLCCYVDETIDRNNLPPVDDVLEIGGEPDVIYDVTLRVRGVIENHAYEGDGMNVGDFFRIGGELPEPGAIHVFGMTVADPEETYFFNSWNHQDNPTRLFAIDYEATIPMRGGTSVRVFEYDDIGKIWANAGGLTVPDLPPFPEPYDGQFMQFDVVSVVPQE